MFYGLLAVFPAVTAFVSLTGYLQVLRPLATTFPWPPAFCRRGRSISFGLMCLLVLRGVEAREYYGCRRRRPFPGAARRCLAGDIREPCRLLSIIPTRTAEHKSGQGGAKLRDFARSGVEAGILV